MPPITNEEHEFYEQKKLCKAYDEDKEWQSTIVEPQMNANREIIEPALHFHEFLFLLGLIAYNCIDSKDSISEKLKAFYIQKLLFKQASEAQMARDLTYDQVYKNEEMADNKKNNLAVSDEYGSEEEWDDEYNEE